MLKQLRNKKTAKKIWIGLAVIIVPAFVLWGFGGAFRSKGESAYAGKIAGRNVPLLEYRDAFEAVRNQAIMQFGDKYSEVLKYLNLETQAWERLILLSEAKKRKITASDSEVIDLLESYPFFQRKGRFDNRSYAETVQYVFHAQPRIFEEQTRQNMVISKLYKQLTDGVKLTDGQIKEEYRRANEEISIYYIASLPLDFKKEISPKESELKDYYAKNALQFKQPLSFNVEYIYSDSENKIKTALRALNKKAEFAKAAKDALLEIKETGPFTQDDSIPGIGWAPQITNLILTLKQGELSQALRIDKNYYIFRVKERKEPYIPEFEEAKNKVGETLVKNKSRELAKEKIDACFNKMKLDPKAANFEKTAAEFGLKTGATVNFKFGSYIEGIGASDNFWLEAQKLKNDEASPPIETPLGFYIIKMKSKTLPDDKKLEAEKEDFSQKLLGAKKQEYFLKFLETLKKQSRMF